MTAFSRLQALCATALCAASLCAADPPVAAIKWIDRDYDFGLMKEQAGPKTGHSRFVNMGPDTVAVFSVKPSCGCTSAEFSDEPLAPGDTAVISYTYDPAMRPGKFDKHVNVRLTNGDRYSIRITGNVLGTPESLSLLYPVDAGDLRLSDPVLNAGEITFGKSPMMFVNAYSLATDSVTPTVTPASPALTAIPSQPKAGSGDIITYSISFDSRSYGKYGPVEIPFSISADGSEGTTVVCRAYVLPDTDRLLMAQQGKNPVCELSPDPIDLGLDVSGVTKSEFTVHNAGKGPLHILHLAAEADGVTFGKLPKEIKPGKSARISVEINPALMPDGPFRIPLEIITDDPHNPRLHLPIAGFKP